MGREIGKTTTPARRLLSSRRDTFCVFGAVCSACRGSNMKYKRLSFAFRPLSREVLSSAMMKCIHLVPHLGPPQNAPGLMVWGRGPYPKNNERDESVAVGSTKECKQHGKLLCILQYSISSPATNNVVPPGEGLAHSGSWENRQRACLRKGIENGIDQFTEQTYIPTLERSILCASLHSLNWRLE